MFLKNANDEAHELQQAKNNKLKDTLPQTDFKKLLNTYYKNKNYKEFIILFLLLNYNTRNRDWIVSITNDKNDLNDKDFFLLIRLNDVVYYRNDYKTAFSYGQKKDIIKSKKFYKAIQDLNSLLINNANLDRQVKEITRGFNQSTLFKINIATNNNLKAITKASKNRGSIMETIANSYDIT